MIIFACPAKFSRLFLKLEKQIIINGLRIDLNQAQGKINRLEKRLRERTDQRDKARKKIKTLKNKQQTLKTVAGNKKISLSLIKHEKITDSFLRLMIIV